MFESMLCTHLLKLRFFLEVKMKLYNQPKSSSEAQGVLRNHYRNIVFVRKNRNQTISLCPDKLKG